MQQQSETLAQLESLVSPYGVVGQCVTVAVPRGVNRLKMAASFIGSGVPGSGRQHRVQGTGRVLDDADEARLVSIAEAAERYSALDLSSFGDPTLLTARAADLPGAVLDLDRVPRCSDREYATEGCPLRPFDPGASIRWERGVDLHSGEPTWVPAIMSNYMLGRRSEAEGFCYSISTGFAVHTDPLEAVVGAICEIAERDSIALTWLQMLPLPLDEKFLMVVGGQ